MGRQTGLGSAETRWKQLRRLQQLVAEIVGGASCDSVGGGNGDRRSLNSPIRLTCQKERILWVAQPSMKCGRLAPLQFRTSETAAVVVCRQTTTNSPVQPGSLARLKREVLQRNTSGLLHAAARLASLQTSTCSFRIHSASVEEFLVPN
ncbi:hypothetical protein F442_12002 [Phytophthora nicotianae P10297]|uniref:Uncharacterized protein n=1 Tax=Phytophthora nicotianae P10297 TaxID=1317064 RepID=W2Z1A5_PHYNI|nr:hypothetical protein F442_12002 [Phytophthora nicotianae P10297]